MPKINLQNINKKTHLHPVELVVNIADQTGIPLYKYIKSIFVQFIFVKKCIKAFCFNFLFTLFFLKVNVELL